MKSITSLPGTRMLCGAGMLLAVAIAARGANPVTFSIDMTAQPTATDVFVRGSFNGWGTSQLANNGSGTYTGTVDIADSPGTVEQCKFFYQPGDNWEGDPNRQFVLASGGQTLPLTAWGQQYPAPTNNVTFQVDMSAQVLFGNFSPGQTVRVAGDFTGWGDGHDLTNNPALSGNATNVYSGIVPVTGFPGGGHDYKFRANSGWESPVSTGGNNRNFQVAGGNQTLPLVFYNDAVPCDLLSQDTVVTFILHITNGAPTFPNDPASPLTFTKGTDYVALNGDFLGWWGWKSGSNPFNEAPPNTVLTNNPPGSDFYQQSVVIPRGQGLAPTYKFSVNGYDNEAGFAVNHFRYVRTWNNFYQMPTDDFVTNAVASKVEQSFGNLVVGSPSGPNVPVTWLGRPCVTLQVRTDLASGSWTDLPASDSAQATNSPNAGTRFFRLQKRAYP